MGIGKVTGEGRFMNCMDVGCRVTGVWCMIILHIEVIAEFDGGIKEKRIATNIATNVKSNADGETVMSRDVALPTAISSRLIVVIRSGYF